MSWQPGEPLYEPPKNPRGSPGLFSLKYDAVEDTEASWPEPSPGDELPES